MKLEIKNLHNDTFTVDCDEEDTVKALKEKIAARDDLREKYDAELLKLLCKGKVMDDEDTISSFTIKPDAFLVLVKQTPGKPKPPPKKKPNQGFNNPMGGFGSQSFMQHPFQQNAFGHQPFQQSPFGQQSFQQNPFGQNAFPENTYDQNAFQQNTYEPQSHTPAANDLSDTSPDAFSTEEDRKEALQSLLAMGFERSKAEKALVASFYNVETAIEYITSDNIPEKPQLPFVPQGSGLGNPSGGPTIQGSPPAVRRQGGGGMGANLQQMRQMLQDHPEQLQTIKRTLQAEHPEIAKMIDDNPQAFLDLLAQAGGDDVDRPATGGGGAGGQGSISVTLSPQEKQTIDRLQEMGFDRNRAIEAFIACDRNENLAINYLLNSFE